MTEVNSEHFSFVFRFSWIRLCKDVIMVQLPPETFQVVAEMRDFFSFVSDKIVAPCEIFRRSVVKQTKKKKEK